MRRALAAVVAALLLAAAASTAVMSGGTAAIVADLSSGQTGSVALQSASSATLSGTSGQVGTISMSAGANRINLGYFYSAPPPPPTLQNGTANIVLGQKTFNAFAPEGGGIQLGPAANTFYGPVSVRVDQNLNVWVADQNNNRALDFRPVLMTNMNASLVLGESGFNTAAGSNFISSTTLGGPSDLAFDPNGVVWVADTTNNRVLRYSNPAGGAADLVLGQSDFVSGLANRTNSATPAPNTLNAPSAVAVDVNGIWVADSGNNRVLHFSAGNYANGAAADVVLGQPNFTSSAQNNASAPAKGLSSPQGLALAGDGSLWVSDFSNVINIARLLRFPHPLTSPNPDIVLGNSDFNFTAARDAAGTFQGPQGVFVDNNGAVWVADAYGNRVMRFSAPISSGMDADLVLGQPDFNSFAVNAGATAPAANTLNFPTDVAVDKFGSVWVADYGNNRVLTFNPPAPRPGAPAVSAFTLGVSSVSFTWNAVGGALSYNVYSAKGGAPTTVNAPQTSVVLTGLSTNTAAGVSVAAVNAVGEGALSSAVTGFTLAAAPAGSTVAAVGVSSEVLTWLPNGNPAGTTYQLQFSTAANFSSAVSTAAVSAASATLTGLLSDATYFTRVQAFNLGGASTTFDAAQTTVTLAAPVAATNVFVNAAGLGAVWTPVAAAQGYRLDASTAPDFSGTIFSTVTPSAAAATLEETSLTPGASYFLRLGSLNWQSTPDFVSLGAATYAVLPSLVGPANGAALSISTPTLVWTPAPAIPHRVQIAQDNGFTQIVVDSTTANAFLVSTNVLTAGNYFWRVGPAAAFGLWTTTQTFSVDAAPPVLSAPQISTAPGSVPWVGISTSVIFSTTSLSLRVSAQDAASGLLVSTGLANGLIGHWHLDESSGTVALDASTSNDVGLLHGGVSRVAGRRGGALSFDGSTGYVEAAGLAGKRSYSFWLNTTNTGQQQIFDGSPTGLHTASELGLTQNGGVGSAPAPPVNTAGVYFAYGGDDVYLPGTNLADGNWHQLAVSWDGGTQFFLAVDGTFPPGLTWNNTAWAASGQPFTLPFTPAPGNGSLEIGGNARAQIWGAGSKFFNGSLDEFRVYSTALSSAQIVALYEADALSAQNRGAAYSVSFSTNAGATWTFLSTGTASLGGTNGTQALQTLEADQIPVVTSTGPAARTDQVSFAVQDFAGNVSTAVYTLFVDSTVSPPSNSAAAYVSTWTVGLSWSAGANPLGTQYAVQAGTAADFSGTILSSQTLALAATFFNTLPETTYYLRVQAVSVFGNATPFDVTVATIAPANATPTLSAPTYGSFVSTGVPIIVWAPSVAGTHRAQIATDAFFNNVVVDSTTANAYATPATPLAQGTYYWRVAATVDPNDWSQTGVFTIDLTPPFYAAPQVQQAGGSWQSLPTANYLSTSPVNVRVTVRDALSGLLTSTGAPAGLSGLFHFNQSTGSVVLDASTGSLSGVLTGGAAWAPGRIGNALSFDGTGMVTFNGVPTTATDNWTLMAWINPASINQLGFFVDNGDDDGFSGAGYGFGVASGGQSAGSHLTAIFSFVGFLDSGYSFPAANAWYQVVMTRGAGTTRFYVNGFQTPNTYNNTPTAPVGHLHVGAQGGSGQPTGWQRFNGLVQEVRVFSSSFTQAQVVAAYQSDVLAAQHAGAPFNVSYSTNSGRTWVFASTASVTLSGANGTATAQTFEADGFNVVTSTGAGAPTDMVAFAASDLSGNVSTATYTLLVDTIAPVVPAGPAYAAVSSIAATVNWTSNGNFAPLTNYLTQLSTSPTFATLTNSATTAATAAVFAVSPNTTYYAEVQAASLAGQTSGFALAGSTLTPPAPPGAAGYAAGASSITVNWLGGADPPGTTYLVQLATDPVFATLTNSSATANLSALFSPLPPNTTYYAQVEAIGFAGAVSSFTPLGQTETSPAPPGAPGPGQGVILVTTGSVQASWGGSLGAFNYLLAASTASAVPPGVVNSSFSTAQTTATAGGLATNTTYYLFASACNAVSCSGYTALGSTITLPVAPAAAAVSVTTASYTANWLANTLPAGTTYVVQLSTDPAFAAPVFLSSGATTALSLTFGGLSADTTYYARAAALGYDGLFSSFTALAGVATSGQVLTGQAYSSVTANQAQANWLMNGNPAGTTYVAILSTGVSPSTNASAGNVSSTTLNTFALFAALNPNTTYFADVQAVNPGGAGTAFVHLGPVVTLAGTPVAAAFSNVIATGATFGWSPNGDPAGTSYSAQLSTDPAFGTLTNSGVLVSTSIPLSLSPNATYYARVQAVSYAGVTTAFAVAGSTLTPPAAPSTAAYLTGGSSITVNWLANNNPAGTNYLVQLATDPAFGTLTSSTQTAGLSFLFAPLSPNTTYYAQVRSIGFAGAASTFTALGLTMTSPVVPAPPGPGQGVLLVTTGSVQASWGASSGAFNYLLAASSGSAVPPVIVSSFSAAQTTTTVAGLAPNATYFLFADACNPFACSAFTPIGSTITLANPPGAGASVPGSSQLTLNWTASGNSPSTLYLAEVSTDPAFGGASTVTTFGRSATFSGLLGGHSYFAQVQAINNAGVASAFTALPSFITNDLAPGAAAFTAVSTGALQANWTSNGSPAGTPYVAILSTSPSPSTNGAAGNVSSTTANTSAVFSGLTPNSPYYVDVQAVSGGAGTAFTALGGTVTLANVPAALAPSGVTTGQLLANWGNNSDTNGTLYVAVLSTAVSPSTNGAPGNVTISTTGLSAAFGGLAPNTTYFVDVQALNSLQLPSAFVSLPSTITAPAPPAPLAYGVPTSTMIPASWQANGDPAGTSYLAVVSTAPSPSTNGDGGNISSITLNTAVLFAGLAPNTTFYVDVAAVGFAGARSTAVALGAIDTAPNAPAAETLTAQTSTQLTASWSANANPAGTLYRVVLATDPAFGSYTASSVTAATSAVFTGLGGNTTFYAQSIALSYNAFPSTASAVASAVTFPTQPSTAAYANQTNMVQANWSSGNSLDTLYQAILSLQPSPSTNGLPGNVSVSTSASFDAAGVPSLSAFFYNLAPNTTYYVDVQALGYTGSTTPFTALGLTMTSPAPPAAPGPGQGILSASSAAVQASWGASLGASSYFLAATLPATDFANAVTSTAATTLTTTTVSGLNPSATYYLAASACNAIACSLYTNLGSTITMAAVPVASPTVVAQSSITVGWLLGNNPAGLRYLVQVSSDPTFTFPVFFSSTFNTTVAFQNLIPATTYFARVEAFNLAGTPSGFGALPAAATGASPPGAAAFTAVLAGTLQANWTPNGNAAATYLAILSTGASPSTNGFAGNASSATANLFAVFSGLAHNATYYVDVQAVGPSGQGGGFAVLGGTLTLPGAPGVSSPTIVTASGFTARWTANGNASSTTYSAVLSTGASPSTNGLAGNVTIATTSLSYVFSGLAAATTYWVDVQAVGFAGSTSPFASLPSTATLANGPGSLAYSGATASQLQANWTANGSPAGTTYVAILSTGPLPFANGFAGNASSTTLNLSALFSGLTPATSYFVDVQAISPGGAGTGFTELGATATVAAVPLAAAPAFVSSTSVTANWTSDGNPGGTPYLVILSTGALPNGFAGNASSVTVNLFAAFTGLSGDATYYAAVSALGNGGGASAFAALPSTTTLVQGPAALAFSVSSSTQLQANWTAQDSTGTPFVAILSTGASPSTNGFSGNVSTQVYALSALFSGLIPDTTYFVDVQALAFYGPAAPFAVLGGTPTWANAPAAAALTAGGLLQLAAGWSANGSPAGALYAAQLSTDPAFGTLTVSSVTTSTKTVFVGLSGNATYYLQVQAVNFAGMATAFVQSGATVTTAAPPGAALYAPASSTTITARWTSGGDAPGTVYQAILSTGPSPSSNGFAGNLSSTTASLSALFTGLSSGASYFVDVQALGVDGPSAFTSLGPVFTGTGAQPGAGPGVLKAGALTITAAWSAAAGTQNYQLAASTNSANPPSPVAAMIQTAQTTATVAGLAPNTTYYLFTTACSRGACGAYVAVGSTLTLAATPEPLAAQQNSGAATLNWGANGNPAGTSYLTQFSTDPAFGVSTSAATASTNTALSGLAFNTTYYARVQAQNAAGLATAFASLPAFVTLATAPVPAAFTSVSSAALQTNWTGGGDPAGTVYVAILSPAAGAATNLLAANQSATTASLSAAFAGLAPNTSYYLDLQALNFAGFATPFTADATTVTLAAVPGTPFAVARGSAATVFQWVANANPSDTVYVAQISTDPLFGVITASVTATGTSALFPALAASATYFARAQAVDRLGRPTAFSGAGSAQTLVSPPGAPSLTAYTVSSGTIRWMWTGGGGAADSFQLVSSTGGLIATLSGSASFYLEAGLSTGTAYSRFLTAVNLTGQAFSSSQTVVTPDLQNFVTGISSGVLLGADNKKELDIPNTNLGTDTRWLVSTNPQAKPLTTVTDSLIAQAQSSLPAGIGGSTSSLTEFIVTVNGQRYTGGFNAPVTVKVPYPDVNNTGFVDGTSPPVRATTLELYVLDETTGLWGVIPNSHVDTINHVVSGQVPHLSIFNAFGTGASANLTGARVYPVPYKPNGSNPDQGVPFSPGNPNSGIVFDNLPASVSIKIYDVAGRLVAGLDNGNTLGKIQWDARNDAGRDVATGAYIAVISAPGSTRVVKKIFIVR